MSFTSDQQTAYNYLTAGYSVFLSGGGGVGKSYVIEEFIKYCDENNKNTVVCASTGIAALNIKGVTAHRTFKIPIGAILDKPNSIPTELKDIDVSDRTIRIIVAYNLHLYNISYFLIE